MLAYFRAAYVIVLQGLHSASMPGILSLDVCLRDTSRIVTGLFRHKLMSINYLQLLYSTTLCKNENALTWDGSGSRVLCKDESESETVFD